MSRSNIVFYGNLETLSRIMPLSPPIGLEIIMAKRQPLLAGRTNPRAFLFTDDGVEPDALRRAHAALVRLTKPRPLMAFYDLSTDKEKTVREIVFNGLSKEEAARAIAFFAKKEERRMFLFLQLRRANE